jgi:superfamily I DNA/RNA helicase
MPIDTAGLRSAFQEALATAIFDGNALHRRAQAQTIERLAPDYLLEEIGSVIEARDLKTLDDYLTAPRAGRRVPLNATQRAAVWRLHEALGRALARRNQPTWEQLRRRAATFVRDGQWVERFDGVIVDEAQDLNPTVLRLLVDVCRSPDRLFITADANQSIYGSGFRWTDVHKDLDFRGRTGILRRNYRSTLQIDQAARSYLHSAALDVPETEVKTAYVRQDGVMPIVRAVATAHDQTQLLHRFIRQATRAYRMGIGGCAVLVPTEEAGKSVAAWLNGEGLAAEFMPGRALDLEKPLVKVLTLKSAKGLEFPIVALGGFDERTFPGVPNSATDEELGEALERERRTVYVGMTRAMLALLVAVPSAPKHPAAALYSGFDASVWNTGDEVAGAA